MPAARLPRSIWPLAIAAVTLLAFALRVPGMGQSLFGDEWFTYVIVDGNGLRGIWQAVFDTSITPPLHYYLAEISSRIGDPTIWMRLPSLVLGTALIPVVFLLGRRVAGPQAGLVAAVVLALGPFAIWYSDEARAYATMMFLVAVSTLALLRALDDGSRRWLVVYVVCACAAMWTHYTAVFVVGLQGLWALWTHREHLRALVVCQVAIVAGWLPWLPGFLNQRQNDEGIGIIGHLTSLDLSRVVAAPLRTAIGHPFTPFEEFPGTAGTLLVLVLAALAVHALVRRRDVLRRAIPSPRSEQGLLVLLALATPVCLLLYDIVGESLYLERNLTASLPAVAVVLGIVVSVLLRDLRPPLALGAVAVMAGLLVFLAIKSFDDEHRRPPYRETAQLIDETARPGDPVVEAPPILSAGDRLPPSSLDHYFDRSHPLYVGGRNDAEVWERLREERDVFYVSQVLEPYEPRAMMGDAVPPPGMLDRIERISGPDGRSLVRKRTMLPGIARMSIRHLRGVIEGRLRRSGGRETISWTLGRRVEVTPGLALGSVDQMTGPDQPLLINGWAIDAERRTPVDWFLFFSRGRLFAVNGGGQPRPTVAERFGPEAELTGFGAALGDGAADRRSIRVFALVGDRAAELPLSVQAKQALGG